MSHDLDALDAVPAHRARRDRPHVAQEYCDNEQFEVAASLVSGLTARAKDALGCASAEVRAA